MTKMEYWEIETILRNDNDAPYWINLKGTSLLDPFYGRHAHVKFDGCTSIDLRSKELHMCDVGDYIKALEELEEVFNEYFA